MLRLRWAAERGGVAVGESGEEQAVQGFDVPGKTDASTARPASFTLVRDGGTVVSTTAFMPAPGDGSRGVLAATVFVSANRERLAELVSLVDDGELTVEVTRRIPLTELAALRAEAAVRRVAGKVIVLPA